MQVASRQESKGVAAPVRAGSGEKKARTGMVSMTPFMLPTPIHTRLPKMRTGRLTRGVVKDVLTKSSYHPHGIKVRPETGEVGRVREVIDGGWRVGLPFR